jgi:fermentation-respiration switch protein FrsA (DUF1100 family)
MAVIRVLLIAVSFAAPALHATAAAQVTRLDYDRALGLRERYRSMVTNVPEPAAWIGTTHRFVYRRSLKGGHEFVLVDATTLQKRPPFDHARLAAALSVGIFGGSAGGQNAMGALLFHQNFYKAAVSYAGCHDNRMDKIWWNEQWMGWPIGPHYDAASNVINASRLQGELLLIVGELDTNVDPSSTMQVVNALIKARKTFELIMAPGENHGALRGGRNAEYGDRARFDFFVRHLLGIQPPDWNRPPVGTTTNSPEGQ